MEDQEAYQEVDQEAYQGGKPGSNPGGKPGLGGKHYQAIKDLMKIPNKELKGLFKGKLGKAFEKLKNLVQKGISWLKKNHL